MLPPCFDHFFQNNLESGNFTKCTRSQSKFYPSFCRLNITKQSLRYRGPLAWNKVPSSIKQIKSYSKFRTEFQKHLIAPNFLMIIDFTNFKTYDAGFYYYR